MKTALPLPRKINQAAYREEMKLLFLNKCPVLPNETWQLLHAFLLDNFSYQQIAQQRNWSKAITYARVRRALTALRLGANAQYRQDMDIVIQPAIQRLLRK